MSLQKSVERALTESEQLKSDKQLLLATKENIIKNAVIFAIKDELRLNSIDILKQDLKKDKIIDNILFETIDDLIANKTEQDFYYYKIAEYYDKEIEKIERKQEREKRKLEKEQKEQERKRLFEEKQQEKERLLKEKERKEKQARQEAIAWEILKILAWIILAPILLIAFIFIEVLKSTK